MAITIQYNVQQLTKEFKKYQPKSLRFVSYRTIEFLGVKVREEVNKGYGKKGFFIDPVPLTLESTLVKFYPKSGKAEVDIFPMDDFLFEKIKYKPKSEISDEIVDRIINHLN